MHGLFKKVQSHNSLKFGTLWPHPASDVLIIRHRDYFTPAGQILIISEFELRTVNQQLEVRRDLWRYQVCHW
ncbi:hypothetical protein AOLI_G00320240 [Acnodon oligacanthus]